jgi:glucose/arabinose dehydrogenase
METRKLNVSARRFRHMTISKSSMIAALLSAVLGTGLAASTRLRAQQTGHWVVPAGFQVDVFAENVVNAREMALGSQGTVFVGSMAAGKVHAVIDRNGDHKAARVVLIASGLDQPNGVATRNGALYVATASRILRFDDIERRLDSPPAPVIVRDSLPNSTAAHTWKFIAFGPDGLLYMSVGAPCNVCLPPPMVSTILRMKPDGSNLEVFAEGVRNTVGFDWHPTSHELFMDPSWTAFCPARDPVPPAAGAPRGRHSVGPSMCYRCRTDRS